MNANLDNIKNKKVLIVGLGRSGIAAAQAMIRLGADVSIQDSKKEETVDIQMVMDTMAACLKNITAILERALPDLAALPARCPCIEAAESCGALQ